MILAAWGCVALLLIVQARAWLGENVDALFLSWSVLQQVMRALYWALLTPLIFRLYELFPLKGPWRYGHLLLHGAVALGLSAVFMGLRVPFLFWLFEVPDFQRNLDRLLARMSLRNLIDPVLYFGVVVAAAVIAQARSRQEAQLEEERLRRKLAEAELAALRQQVQPHFLFNALNSAASLVRAERGAEAVTVLARLGAMHRRLVETRGTRSCSLAEEFDFLLDYLAVERARFAERLRVNLDLPDDCREIRVPNLLLQPLVENAVKHGAALRRDGGAVEVSARREVDRLHLKIRNDMPARPPNTAPEGLGFGLRHTRERLARLSGHASLQVERGEDWFEVRIDLAIDSSAEA